MRSRATESETASDQVIVRVPLPLWFGDGSGAKDNGPAEKAVGSCRWSVIGKVAIVGIP